MPGDRLEERKLRSSRAERRGEESYDKSNQLIAPCKVKGKREQKKKRRREINK